MFVVGVAMGPIHHVYYLQLDKILPRADIKTVTKKILCDQAIASPLTILCFFFAMGSLEKKTLSQVTSEIRKKFLYAYMVSLRILRNIVTFLLNINLVSRTK